MKRSKFDSNNIEFTDNPKHGIVKEVKKRRDELIAELIKNCMDLLKEGKISEKQSIEDAINIIAKEKPDLMLEYQRSYDEFSFWATICLATNKIWKEDEIDELSEKEFWELFEKSKKVIGGTVDDFLAKYTSFGFSQMNSNQE